MSRIPLMVRRARGFVLVVACAFAGIGPTAHAREDVPASQPSQAWQTIEELWYVMEMGGGKAGWMSVTTQKQGEQLRTISQTTLEISRGEAAVKIEMSFTFDETADGKPLQIESRQKMATREVTSRHVFHEDKVASTTIEAGKAMSKTSPLPSEPWLPPQAVERYTRAQRAAGAQEIAYKTINPESGLMLISITSKLAGGETLELPSGPTPVTVWKTRTTIVPVEVIEKYDADGNMVYNEMPMLGKVIMRLATKQEAMRKAGAPGDGAEGGAGAGGMQPELLAQSFIKPDKPIDNHMKAATSRLRLRMANGEALSLPSAGAQRVEPGDDHSTAILKVDINDNLPATPEEIADKAYTDPSPLVDSTDALVMKHAARAVKDAGLQDADAFAKAEALRAYVRKHISRKGMQTAFASASETANTREGDCSEHGVLLCAMLRAQGIPARVAAGLVYADAFAGADGIFGWHMWTQALIDGKWVDFDATLPVRYNAVHVLAATSSLADGFGGAEMASIVPLLGNLEIEVIEVGYGDKPEAALTKEQVLKIARDAVAANDDWIKDAEFDTPEQMADGSWTVMAWRLPKTPGGHRLITINRQGKVTDYGRGA